MRMRTTSWVLGLFLLAACGCGESPKPQAAAPPESKTEYSLTEWLEKPRSEQAEHANEIQNRITLQRRAVLEGRLRLGFLPKLPMPLVIPIWSEATYSTKRGISLPPYVQENDTDPELALHLAAFGDTAGAEILADAKDEATRKAIAEYADERNYPAEWTRLAALLLYDAELKLARGEAGGARELMAYHWEIKKLLTPKAAKGWLGQALLPVGRLAFEQAIPSWQADHANELVKEAKACLADKGEYPVQLKFNFDVPYESLKHTFSKEKASRAALAGDPRRAIDLLCLPFPAGGVSAAVAFFDSQEKFTQLLILYRAGLAEGYKDAEHLVRPLIDRGLKGQAGEESLGMIPRRYQVGQVRCEAEVMPRSTVIGGFVHLRPESLKADSPYHLERTFGVASLDRSFEQNRLQLVPQQRKDVVTTQASEALKRVANPLPEMPLQQLSIERSPKQELTSALDFGFHPQDTKPVPFHKVLMPRWSLCGFAPFRGVIDEAGGHFSFVWQDERTRDELMVPLEVNRSVHLRVSDRTDTSDIATKVESARGNDLNDRKSRLAAGKPIQRIPRKLDQFFLGATREEIMSRLPTGHSALKRDIPGGIVVLFPTEHQGNDTHVLRQAFVRFNDKGHAVEIRARYDDGPARGKGPWQSEMLKDLQKRCGAPEKDPSPWAALWTDLPVQKPAPSAQSWTDDVSHLQFNRDAGGVEVTLVDCPIDEPAGVSLPPLEALPRGPGNCLLGMTRAQIDATFGGKEKTAADGALVLRPAASSGFDALLVWFDKDRVARIVARHTQPSGKDLNTLSEAVRTAWTRGLRSLGWPRRQDMAPASLLQGLAWHDDVTRIRIFWQEPDDGPTHVFTEWKALPTQ